jgi:hypothetical protein
MAKAITSFQSIPLSKTFFVLLINEGQFMAARALYSVKKDLRNSKSTQMLLKNGLCDDELLEELKSDHELLKSIWDLVVNSGTHEETTFHVKVVDAAFLDSLSREDKSSGYRWDNLGSDMAKLISPSLVLENMNKFHFSAYNPFYIEWTQEIEDKGVSGDGFVRIMNPPEWSQYRRSFLLNEPSKATDDELVEMTRTSLPSSRLQGAVCSISTKTTLTPSRG